MAIVEKLIIVKLNFCVRLYII